jgi:hypothetical protein
MCQGRKRPRGAWAIAGSAHGGWLQGAATVGLWLSSEEGATLCGSHCVIVGYYQAVEKTAFRAMKAAANFREESPFITGIVMV